ncbi:MAG: anti-sigma factor family protein [Vicinamibacterales bacterium]
MRPCGCSSVVKFLADYLEHQLPESTKHDLEAHLERCPRCVAQLRTYESTVSLLRSLTDRELPPELRLQVTSFLDHKCPKN